MRAPPEVGRPPPLLPPVGRPELGPLADGPPPEGPLPEGPLPDGPPPLGREPDGALLVGPELVGPEEALGPLPEGREPDGALLVGPELEGPLGAEGRVGPEPEGGPVWALGEGEAPDPLGADGVLVGVGVGGVGVALLAPWVGARPPPLPEGGPPRKVGRALPPPLVRPFQLAIPFSLGAPGAEPEVDVNALDGAHRAQLYGYREFAPVPREHGVRGFAA